MANTRHGAGGQSGSSGSSDSDLSKDERNNALEGLGGGSSSSQSSQSSGSSGSSGSSSGLSDDERNNALEGLGAGGSSSQSSRSSGSSDSDLSEDERNNALEGLGAGRQSSSSQSDSSGSSNQSSRSSRSSNRGNTVGTWGANLAGGTQQRANQQPTVGSYGANLASGNELTTQTGRQSQTEQFGDWDWSFGWGAGDDEVEAFFEKHSRNHINKTNKWADSNLGGSDPASSASRGFVKTVGSGLLNPAGWGKGTMEVVETTDYVASNSNLGVTNPAGYLVPGVGAERTPEQQVEGQEKLAGATGDLGAQTVTSFQERPWETTGSAAGIFAELLVGTHGASSVRTAGRFGKKATGKVTRRGSAAAGSTVRGATTKLDDAVPASVSSRASQVHGRISFEAQARKFLAEQKLANAKNRVSNSGAAETVSNVHGRISWETQARKYIAEQKLANAKNRVSNSRPSGATSKVKNTVTNKARAAEGRVSWEVNSRRFVAEQKLADLESRMSNRINKGRVGDLRDSTYRTTERAGAKVRDAKARTRYEVSKPGTQARKMQEGINEFLESFYEKKAPTGGTSRRPDLENGPTYPAWDSGTDLNPFRTERIDIDSPNSNRPGSKSSGGSSKTKGTSADGNGSSRTSRSRADSSRGGSSGRSSTSNTRTRSRNPGQQTTQTTRPVDELGPNSRAGQRSPRGAADTPEARARAAGKSSFERMNRLSRGAGGFGVFSNVQSPGGWLGPGEFVGPGFITPAMVGDWQGTGTLQPPTERNKTPEDTDDRQRTPPTFFTPTTITPVQTTPQEQTPKNPPVNTPRTPSRKRRKRIPDGWSGLETDEDFPAFGMAGFQTTNYLADMKTVLGVKKK